MHRTLRQLAVWPLSANKRECPVGTPSLSLFFAVIRVMYSQLQHGNEKRISLCFIRILGDIVGLRKAVTVAAPVCE